MGECSTVAKGRYESGGGGVVRARIESLLEVGTGD